MTSRNRRPKRVHKASVDGECATVEGAGYRSSLGLIREIRHPADRGVFVDLPVELRVAWCRTPGALYRPLIPLLAAGRVAIDAAGRCGMAPTLCGVPGCVSTHEGGAMHLDARGRAFD